MTKLQIAKIAGIAAGATLVFGSFVPLAGAVTIAELQAQINALMAQLATLQGGSVSGGTTFTQNLTIGSTGAEVTALQQMLVAQGHLVMPVGVAYGYFGNLTKAAVAKWQMANGVTPAAGYFGAISRAKANMTSGGTPIVPGSTVGITTPGVEGTLTATKAASPASGTKVYEGSLKVAVLGIELEAKTSDIKVERVKLDLDCSTCSPGTDQDLYRKIGQKIYAMDGSTVLGSMDLSVDTVVEDGSDRFITIAGLNFVVPKNTKKVLTIAVDARSNWDSTYDGDSWTLAVAADGVRGVDGAGVNQYSPAAATTITNSFTSEGELADSATLTVSTNSSTPLDMDVIAAQGTSENELDGLTLLAADFRAEKDAVTITDLVVDITRTGSTATTSTGYLYVDGTLIDSDSIDTDTHSGFTFDDIDYVIPRDATRTLTVKVDVDSAVSALTSFVADIDTADVTAENSNGTALTESGSATGETIGVRNSGPEFTLLSKSITYTAAAGVAGATSTAKATFVLRVKAVGSAVEFGDTGSTTYALADNNNTIGGGQSSDVYAGGALSNPDVSSSTAMTIPSGVTAAADANSWVLGEGNSIDIPIDFIFEGRVRSGAATGGTLISVGAYAVGLERLNWLTSVAGRQETVFMNANSAWRTSTVTMP